MYVHMSSQPFQHTYIHTYIQHARLAIRCRSMACLPHKAGIGHGGLGIIGPTTYYACMYVMYLMDGLSIFVFPGRGKEATYSILATI